MSSRPLWRRLLPVAILAALAIPAAATAIPAFADDTARDPGQSHAKIVGGGSVSDDKPWISALHNGGSFTCTSSQIGAEWVITANHCVEGGGDFTVRIGSLERSSGGTMRTVDQVVSHPDYNWPLNDMALLHLSEPFDNTYAPLASPADIQQGQESTIYGWGSENPDWSGPLPEHLKYSNGNTTAEGCDWNNVICVKGDGGVAGGDSGGPAFVKSAATGEYVQMGVCAVGYQPADQNWSGYTSIAANRDWIKQVSGL